MRQMLFFVFSSFWAGAVHAATPGHGKTIAAAYIVGARGKPIDAVILGVFVTLSHTSGIVLVGILASLGSVWLRPQRIEAYLALTMGLLVIGLGLWMLWLQRGLFAYAIGESSPVPAALAAQGETTKTTMAGRLAKPDAHAFAHVHDHSVEHNHTHGSHNSHDHAHGENVGWHTHGWGTYHSHRLDVVTDQRPKLAILLALGIAGGLLPDPTALALLIAALSSGKVLLGLITVLVFSLGFAATLVVVGVIAAQVGQRVLEWLTSVWAVRLQIATTLLILGMGVVLTFKAAMQLGMLSS